MKMIGLVVIFFGACLSLSAETRIWTDAKGVRFEGVYNKELLGGVQIKDMKGGNHLIRMEQLSTADLDYIESRVPPEVDAKVDSKTRMLLRTKWARDDDDTTIYTFTVTVKKTSKLAHKGQLSAELFVVANERSVQSREHLVLMQRKATPFVFPEDKEPRYEFSVPNIQFEAYRAAWINLPKATMRGKTYLGYIVSVSDSTGHIIFCDTDISGVKWITDDLPLSVEKLRELYINHPGSAENRHFNDSFRRISPPRIPWFQRQNHN